MSDERRTTNDHPERRDALAGFLRTRRERLTPAQVGLPPGFRRRTPGLRREEVAQLADVGTTWYTWLEQGRDVRPSAAVLDALADALRLDRDERAHLYALAGRPFPAAPVAAPPITQVSPALQTVLDSLDPNPAFVRGWRWDVWAWNRAACAVFADFAALPAGERNIVRLLFTDPRARERWEDWDGIARATLALFRADHGRHADDPAFAALIADLHAGSAEFRRWWPRHEVRGKRDGRKVAWHPAVGTLTLHHAAFAVHDAPDLTLVVYTPLPECNTAAKLRRLIADV